MSSEKTTVTYWVTKYALTQGIFEVPPGEGEFGENPDYLYMGTIGHMPTQVVKADFFLTLAEAEQRVEQLKESKLRSLEKALNKIKHYKAKVITWRERE